ncbi:hypothetical protein C8Q73DRAFT_53422 [Cubamyces lactineus]|nr:hypothetical protein C8Q73DRAFT_53422 [Cubamyces lactineus]
MAARVAMDARLNCMVGCYSTWWSSVTAGCLRVLGLGNEGVTTDLVSVSEQIPCSVESPNVLTSRGKPAHCVLCHRMGVCGTLRASRRGVDTARGAVQYALVPWTCFRSIVQTRDSPPMSCDFGLFLRPMDARGLTNRALQRINSRSFTGSTSVAFSRLRWPFCISQVRRRRRALKISRLAPRFAFAQALFAPSLNPSQSAGAVYDTTCTLCISPWNMTTVHELGHPWRFQDSLISYIEYRTYWCDDSVVRVSSG